MKWYAVKTPHAWGLGEGFYNTKYILCAKWMCKRAENSKETKDL